MTPLRIRLKKSEFDAVKYGRKTEVTKSCSNKRIHSLCFSRLTHDCSEPQSKCRECFDNARQFDGYMCYPFGTAIIRRGLTDNYTTKPIEDVTWEERDGKIVFIIKFKGYETSEP